MSRLAEKIERRRAARGAARARSRASSGEAYILRARETYRSRHPDGIRGGAIVRTLEDKAAIAPMMFRLLF